jgi:hypothetical protein
VCVCVCAHDRDIVVWQIYRQIFALELSVRDMV